MIMQQCIKIVCFQGINLNPGMNVELSMKTTYISDYVISQVLTDLQKYLKLSYADAYDLLYRC